MTDRPAGRRVRRTLVVDAMRFDQAVESALALELRRTALGRPRLTLGPLRTRADREGARQQLMALLKAYVDAGRPAGGLPLDETGRVRDRAALVQAARTMAESGLGLPKVLTKIRSGAPIDRRLVEAIVHYFRHALDDETFRAERLGVAESLPLRAVARIGRAIDAVHRDLPASILDGLQRRAAEVASYPWVMDDVRYEYDDLVRVVDPQGVPRLKLTKRTRYRPVRLLSLPGLLRPMQAYEWHEWNHVESARLRLWQLDSHDRRVHGVDVPIRKRIDEQRMLVVVDPEPAAGFEMAAAGTDGPRCEVEWEERLVFNLADRDIVVSFLPMNRPAIVFDAARNPGFEVAVGDSPGLRRTADGWLLDRTLMPREVLAVRLRPAGLDAGAAPALSPAGEWPPEPR